MIRGALLLGSNHETLGEVTIEDVSPHVAIGISRGRFPKGYPHVDPNEDAVFAATDDTTTVLAVADGHNGFDAARAAILAIADTTPTAIGGDPEGIIRALVGAAIGSVAQGIPGLDPPRDASRTALTICVIRDDSLTTATLGDTACFVATKRRVERVGTRTRFLSPTTDPDRIHIETVRLKSGGTVFAISDGVIDFTQPTDRTIRTVAKHTPHEAVEALIAAAFAGGAGDHITAAVTSARSH